jgi:hypothetical protein
MTYRLDLPEIASRDGCYMEPAVASDAAGLLVTGAPSSVRLFCLEPQCAKK